MSRFSRFLLIGSLTSFGLAGCGGDAGDTVEETDTPVAGESATGAEAAAPTPAPAAGSTLLDPNVATREELTTIPGIDVTTADAIIARRPYATMLEVDQVLPARLDEAQRDSIYTRLWKRIDLNNASEEEIMLIPGVGDRMAHEFEEYRPYDAIERFRREIGKYVDPQEVARLEQYVELR